MSAFYTSIARFYDAETGGKTDDLRLYQRLAAQYPGDVLDVGCGTGRVLIHLAQAGCRAHGIDSDAAMLERLARKLRGLPHLQDHISYAHADALRYDCAREFGLILLSYNALMHFHEQESQIALLRRLRGWLADEGRLVIDLPNAGDAFAAQDTDALTLERTFLEPESGHQVMLQSVSCLDRVTQILHVDWIYDEMDGEGRVRRIVAPHRLRYFFLPELTLLLKLCGFAVDGVYGDADGARFEDGCERMIALAGKLGGAHLSHYT